MNKLFAAILIVLVNTPNLFSQNIEYKIHELMNAYADNGQFNGTILVKKGGNVIYKNAFGLANREWNVPNTIDSKFLIGSIGKPFTALMTLILVDEGLVDLDSTINTYIPEYSGPGKKKATIHQMLTHTSGIPDHGAIPNLSKKRVRWIYSSDEYLQLINEVESKFEAGTGFQYSGIAYNILAIICEKVTKKDFGDLLKERIFIPLEMKDTKHDKNLDIDTKRANGYEYHLLEGYINPSYIEMCHVKGSGGILSTVEDMAKFSDECFNTQKLLSKDLYKKMFTPYIKDWQYYGYGWWIRNKNINGDSLTIINHGGSTDGYKAYLTRIVEDSIDIIMCQNNYYRTELGVKFDYFITNEIIDILYGKEYLLPKKSLAKEMGYIIGHDGIDAAIKKYYSLKKDKKYFIDDNDFNQLGKELHYWGGKELNYWGLKNEWFKIYELGIKEYPNSFLLNYSFGKLLNDNKNEEAINYLRRCIELYDNNSENKEYIEEYNQAQSILNTKE
ncbi:MAG: beta-lactamase family protein [Ignavibacteriales bacterium]|nr:MAG: beta-lactamase family protein [Ignavibacteriales bacterium]